MATNNGERNINYKFVVSGPESTGKSSLCKQLAKHFDGHIVPEYARTYLDQQGHEYDESDLIKIADGQQKLIDKAHAELNFCDTDLLTVIIWLATRFGKENEAMLKKWLDFNADLYLVCKPDVPWIYDPLRECEHIREDLFDLHIQLLKEYKKEFVIIEGSYTKRFDQAVFEVNQKLNEISSR